MKTLIIAKPGKIIIEITSEEEAWDLAHAFHFSDGFHQDVASAICQAWPDDEEID